MPSEKTKTKILPKIAAAGFFVLALVVFLKIFLPKLDIDLTEQTKNPKSYRVINGDIYWIPDKESKELAFSKEEALEIEMNPETDRKILDLVDSESFKFVKLATSNSGKGVVLLAEARDSAPLIFYLNALTEKIYYVDFAEEIAWPKSTDNYFAYTKKPVAIGPRELYLYDLQEKTTTHLMKEPKGKCMMSYTDLEWINQDTEIRADYTLFDCPFDPAQPAKLKGEVTVPLPE